MFRRNVHLPSLSNTIMNRRRYLLALAAAGAAATAGCAEDDATVEEAGNPPENETNDANETDTPQDPDTETGTEETESDDPEPTTFEFGDTVEFSNDEVSLEFRPHNARFRNALIYNTGPFIQSEHPDNDLFLLMDLSMTNNGESSVGVPSELQLVADSTQYDWTQFSFAFDQNYTGFEELRPGVTQELTVGFEIRDTGGEATLFAEWGNFADPVTAQWQLDLGAVERDLIDLTALPVGRAAEIGTDTARYRIAVQEVTFSEMYTYEGFDGQRTARADAGTQWAIVGVGAENIGERSVSVPTRFDMQLVADRQRYNPTISRLDNSYSGGELAPGAVTGGPLVFEVPEQVSNATMRIDLTTDLSASWALR